MNEDTFVQRLLKIDYDIQSALSFYQSGKQITDITITWSSQNLGQSDTVSSYWQDKNKALEEHDKAYR
jgi:hypothetical protein